MTFGQFYGRAGNEKANPHRQDAMRLVDEGCTQPPKRLGGCAWSGRSCWDSNPSVLPERSCSMPSLQALELYHECQHEIYPAPHPPSCRVNAAHPADAGGVRRGDMVGGNSVRKLGRVYWVNHSTPTHTSSREFRVIRAQRNANQYL